MPVLVKIKPTLKIIIRYITNITPFYKLYDMEFDKMNRKLIAVDLDGTIITKNDNVHERTLTALKKVKDLGHEVMIATGRTWNSSKHIYELLNLNSPLANVNGAIIWNPCDINFTKITHVMNKDDLMIILNNETISSMARSIAIDKGDYLYINNDHKAFSMFIPRGIGPRTFEEFINGDGNDIYRMMVIVDNESSYSIVKKIIETNFPYLLARGWRSSRGDNYFYCEIHAVAANKIHAVALAAKYYNIPIDDTIAFGDGNNDIEMLSNVNLGVLMKNSDVVNANKFKHRTNLSNLDGGVGEFLENYFNLES